MATSFDVIYRNGFPKIDTISPCDDMVGTTDSPHSYAEWYKTNSLKEQV